MSTLTLSTKTHASAATDDDGYELTENGLRLLNCREFFSDVFDAVPTCWIGGGALRDYFLGRPLDTDVDCFFKDERALNVGIASIDRTHAKLLYDRPQIRGYQLGGLHVQLIKGRYFRSLRHMVDSFDFTVCSVGVSYAGEVEYHSQFFADLWSMTLRANCMSCPTHSLARMVRYMGKGFTPGEGLLTALTRAVAAANLEDPSENRLEFYASGEPRFKSL